MISGVRKLLNFPEESGVEPFFIDIYSHTSRLVRLLRLSRKTEAIAFKVLDVVTENNLIDMKQATAIASAVTYIASRIVGEKRAQRELQRTSSVTEASFRNHYNNLMNSLLITLKI